MYSSSCQDESPNKKRGEKVKTREMKAEMKRQNDTLVKLAEYLGLSTASLSYRINNKTEWRANEIRKVATRYNLSAARTMELFFENISS